MDLKTVECANCRKEIHFDYTEYPFYICPFCGYNEEDEIEYLEKQRQLELETQRSFAY
jgi:predicted RNA-binding Zn-ribbon protein involved in translation (DUF1610 family)